MQKPKSPSFLIISKDNSQQLLSSLKSINFSFRVPFKASAHSQIQSQNQLEYYLVKRHPHLPLGYETVVEDQEPNSITKDLWMRNTLKNKSIKLSSKYVHTDQQSVNLTILSRQSSFWQTPSSPKLMQQQETQDQIINLLRFNRIAAQTAKNKIPISSVSPQTKVVSIPRFNHIVFDYNGQKLIKKLPKFEKLQPLQQQCQIKIKESKPDQQIQNETFNMQEKCFVAKSNRQRSNIDDHENDTPYISQNPYFPFEEFEIKKGVRLIHDDRIKTIKNKQVKQSPIPLNSSENQFDYYLIPQPQLQNTNNKNSQIQLHKSRSFIQKNLFISKNQAIEYQQHATSPGDSKEKLQQTFTFLNSSYESALSRTSNKNLAYSLLRKKSKQRVVI